MEAALDRKVGPLEQNVSEINRKLVNMDEYISKLTQSDSSTFNFVQQWLNDASVIVD